jgi:hypothetical protein
VHVHDFSGHGHAPAGIDHEKLIFRHQGRRYRLTDVAGKVVKGNFDLSSFFCDQDIFDNIIISL